MDLLLIDNYDSFTWNLVHFFGDLGARCTVKRNDEIAVADALAHPADAIVLSPGPCDPDRAGICLDLIAAARQAKPMLGVCLGHQAIGQAFGGDVVRATSLMHGKRSAVHHRGCGLMAGLPDGFMATRYHSLTVKPETLPEDLVATAWTEDGTIMAVSHRTMPIHGVQFHPESIASEHGHRILKTFLDLASRRNAE